VTHQGLFPAVTISFNLKPCVALGDAVNAIDAASAKVGLPATIQTEFAGTAQAYQASLATEPILVTAALVTVTTRNHRFRTAQPGAASPSPNSQTACSMISGRVFATPTQGYSRARRPAALRLKQD
jgi:hypothetical protein